jgi:polar amino acid transport system substrate-binding protein
MNVKHCFKMLAAVCVLTFGAHAAADDLELLKPGQLKVATLGTFPPFSMRSPNGQLDGLEVRVMKEIAKRLNLEYTPVLVQWDSLLVALEANQFDVSTSAMDITPARQKQIIFSDGWIESGARILTPKDSSIKSAADLKGKRVGTQVSSTYAVLAEEHGAVVKSYKSESDTVQDLANRNVDAVITDSITGAYLIKHVGLPISMTDDYVSHIQKGFAFKKGKPNLVAAVNKALADMKADGTYAALTTSLIGYDPAPQDPIRSLPQ